MEAGIYMRRILTGSLVVLFALSLVLSIGGCDFPQKWDTLYNFDEAGNYTGFSQITFDYTADQAIADGCIVISDNNLPMSELLEGADTWQEFVKKTEKGRAAFVRAVYFSENETFYTDLYYTGSEYAVFDSSRDTFIGVRFPFLKELKSQFGNPPKETGFYVLTDRTDLTFDDVMNSLLSSHFDPQANKHFETLWFTYYLDIAP